MIKDKKIRIRWPIKNNPNHIITTTKDELIKSGWIEEDMFSDTYKKRRLANAF